MAIGNLVKLVDLNLSKNCTCIYTINSVWVINSVFRNQNSYRRAARIIGFMSFPGYPRFQHESTNEVSEADLISTVVVVIVAEPLMFSVLSRR